MVWLFEIFSFSRIRNVTSKTLLLSFMNKYYSISFNLLKHTNASLNFTIKRTFNFGGILFRKNSHSQSAVATLRHINKKFDQMIRIRINEKEKKVSLSLRCQMAESVEREFNLNRSLDEPISATFQKLYSNFSKQLNQRLFELNFLGANAIL